ncbi:sema domain, immunoglobulin domain (Ig), short basic domain, secreted, (semaphorin) 3H isoform X1 [Pseudochaenichthys georgianus]|uniref:sema domain, immunoglobulin domain (Ig), short basic domain, secreted, (semaphorin) 3H isoform X1 n=1 Tax=Pseudochaenichthys georgianus TaxID=52239 RepID=UPI00146F5111|nr:sema domain, immunoglobulin domain (Ig), short basic domain, secreted, (semaphorin) 3H isoform X1 [Pseudochaenichthys georgianus]
MYRLVTAVLLAHLGASFTGAWRASQPRLQFTHSELIQNGRLLTLPLVAGDMQYLLPDEDRKRLYVAMKDNLLSTSLDDITQNPRKLYWPASPDRVQECLMAGKDPELECANFLRVLQPFNQTHLYVCGTGAFNPRCAFIATSIFQQAEHQTLSYSQTECGKGKCPYDPFQKTASAVVDGELYAGITSDFMSRDSAFFRSLGNRHVIRTEQYDSTWLQDAQFVRVVPLSETDNPEDDKVYVFFTERAQEADGAAGKVLYSRVARVCKNDIGGQRSLVNKWSTFQKARMVCSVPGPDGLQTHFDQLQDIFILQAKDKNNPLIYGLFTTSSDILNGSAVCVYRMEDVVRAFKGNFLHKEGPQYKWAEFTGKVPYPRPGTCPSSTYGSYSSTREYPDDVIFFSRTHPLLQENVLPLGERPLLVRVGVHYKFSKLLVDRVEAVDGTYDVLFIGTDSGLVLKAIHLPREHGQGQEVTLEQMQVFQHKSPVTAMTLSKKKQWLFVGSREGVSQLALYQCELYGQACAECCLARDPYCTWDGHACSPYMPTVRRRNARHLGEEEDPLTQCVRQGAGLQVEAEQRIMMVAEGNSTYLECLPRSRHAAVTWYKQAGENSPELNQVVTGDQLVVIERGVLIRRAELTHGGVYHCQVEEHGYHWTAVTVRLAVWSPSANRVLASWSASSYQSTGSQPWYEDVMALVHPGNIGQHCKALGYRPPRNHRHYTEIKVEQKKEKEKGERHKHGGGRGGGGGGGGRAAGRKSRSKPQQRAPRSA